MVDERLGNLNNRLNSDQSSITPTCDRVTTSPSESTSDTTTTTTTQSSNSSSTKDKHQSNNSECKRSKSLSNTSSLDQTDDTKPKADVKKCRSNPVDGELIQRDKDFELRTCDEAEDTDGKDGGTRQDDDDDEAGCSNSQKDGGGGDTSPRNSDGNRDDQVEPTMPMVQCSGAVRRLKQENERLQVEVTRLRRLVVAGATAAIANKKDVDPDDKTLPEKVIVLEHELQLAREALISLKSDRKRLKAEKFDLLNQMKQLYAILEDKEKELRDFIRNYEQRVRESETSLQQLSTEREERERERWSLLRHARDEAERSLSLAAQLNSKELQLKHAHEQLQDSNPLQARRQLVSSGCLSDQESLASLPRGGAMTPGSTGFMSRDHHGLGIIPGDRNSCSADSGVRCSSDRESGATSAGGNLSDTTTDGAPTITVEGSNVDVDTISVVSSIAPSHLYQSISTPKDCSPTLSPLNANVFSRSIDAGILSRSVEQLASPTETEPITINRKVKTPHSRLGGRGGTWGSISRVFARSRHRNKTNSLQDNSENWYDPYRSWSPLTEEGYTEKLRLLREASTVPMERWRAPTVLAWLEIALGMPQYGPRFAENVKSGKVLLELSDIELECGLGISHPMHRKKLRLAIEEHRHPTLIRYPCIAQLGHTWVSSEWLPDIGLAQYTENFTTNMVDARMLDNISKKELEKFLGVTRKFHQASIVHGIHLLRIVKYDRQALAVRRHQCENIDADPLVWTNRRFIRWARNIDLGEYADNLKDSGVHGGLVVLEPSFNGDTMATALGIPTSKNIIRRHLSAELESLILPARSTLEHYVRIRSSRNKSSFHGTPMGKSYSRSCAAKLATTTLEQNSIDEDTFKNHFTGTLSRAFGFSKSKPPPSSEQEKHSPTSSSETSSVASYVSLPQSRLEGPLYGRHVYGCKMAEDYDSRPPSSISTSHINKKEDSGHSSIFSGKGSLLSNLVGGSLHRSKRRHRRVKSISDIDVMNLEQLML